MRKSSFLFTVAAGLLVSSAASTPARGGSFVYLAITDVVVTSSPGHSAEYLFNEPFIGQVRILVPPSNLSQISVDFVPPNELVFDFNPVNVGTHLLDFYVISPISTLAITNGNMPNYVDGSGYIVVLSFTATAVPEPPSLVLLGIGAVLGPLGSAWRRRKQGRERCFPAKQIL